MDMTKEKPSPVKCLKCKFAQAQAKGEVLLKKVDFLYVYIISFHFFSI